MLAQPNGGSGAGDRLRNLGVAAALAFLLVLSARAADDVRQAEVAQRGAQVMPFDLKATRHIFTKTIDGGVQRVVVKDDANIEQIELIRQHLRHMQARFQRGDFSGPSHIHGDNMSGLDTLKAAKPGEISFVYRDIDGGAELAYRTKDSSLVTALHAWFDNQVSDHGADAVQGDEHSHSHVMMH